MTKNKLENEANQSELIKYRDLVIATIDYYLENDLGKTKTPEFDSTEYYKQLKEQTEEHFKNRRLTRLKQWFRDLTEMPIECLDVKFNEYLKAKTKYDIDIFKSYYKRVEKIIEKEKITTDNQFYDITIMIERLCQADPIDTSKIQKLNSLICDYEQRKTRSRKRLPSALSLPDEHNSL